MLLRENGADEMVFDSGNVRNEVLELIAIATLEDKMVCMVEIVWNKWSFEDFNLMERIPTVLNLTPLSGGPEEFIRTPLNELVEQI